MYDLSIAQRLQLEGSGLPELLLRPVRRSGEDTSPHSTWSRVLPGSSLSSDLKLPLLEDLLREVVFAEDLQLLSSVQIFFCMDPTVRCCSALCIAWSAFIHPCSPIGAHFFLLSMSSASDATPLCSPCDSTTSTSSGRTFHPVYSLYACIDVFNQYWECKACGWHTKGGSVRRKMEHSLGTKTGNARTYQKAAGMCEETQELLSEALVELDRREADKRKRKEVSTASTASLVVPKRQKKVFTWSMQECA